MKKKIDFSKTIGMVKFLNGTYGPSNDKSAEKLATVLRLTDGGAPEGFILSGHELDYVRGRAKQAGFKIMIGRSAL